MAGEALTTQFMLSSATLMLGPQASMFDLQANTHGLGLVKNVKVSSKPAFKDLTQGIQNKVVFSVRTESTTSVSAEVYEYTGRNLKYILGLDGGVNAPAVDTVTTIGSATTSGASTMSVVSAAGIAANAWLMISDPVFPDRFYVREVLSVASNVLTLKSALPSVVLPIGTVVTLLSPIDIGSNELQPFLSAKIIGTTADGKPAGFLFPKVRVVNGFDFGFMTDDFSNLPIELAVYDLVPSDPLYSQFSNKQGMFLGV